MILPSKSSQTILNLGAGKEQPLDLPEDPYMLVNLDSGYYDNDPDVILVSNMATFHKKFLEDPSYIRDYTGKYLDRPQHIEFVLKEDAFKFMEKYPVKFDRIVIYRFLEHVRKSDVLYTIYLMSTSLRSGGIIDCIVPNYRTLAQRILDEDVTSKDFEAEDIITTYELLNEPEGPHCSIWTPDRIVKFFELEKRFHVGAIEPAFNFDGRNIYIRTIIERI